MPAQANLNEAKSADGNTHAKEMNSDRNWPYYGIKRFELYWDPNKACLPYTPPCMHAGPISPLMLYWDPNKVPQDCVEGPWEDWTECRGPQSFKCHGNVTVWEHGAAPCMIGYACLVGSMVPLHA